MLFIFPEKGKSQFFPDWKGDCFIKNISSFLKDILLTSSLNALHQLYQLH